MKSVSAEWRKYPERYTAKEKGVIYSFSKVLVAPKRFEKQVPYFVILVKLESGKMVTSHLVDAHEEDVVIGARVVPVFRKISHDGGEAAISYGTKYILVT